MGVLEVNRAISGSYSEYRGLHNVIREIDEDYAGNLHAGQEDVQKYNCAYKAEDSDWLPCCSGDRNDMGSSDAFKSAKGIFDCTCLKPPGVMKL